MNKTFKKSVKKAIKFTLTAAITALTGLGTAAISFNLFDNLTANQMKILFAVDIICLITGGGIFLCLAERKSAKRKAQRRYDRFEKMRVENIDPPKSREAKAKTLTSSDFAA